MSKISFKKIAILIPLLIGISCGDGDVGTGVSNPPTIPTTATTTSKATETATAAVAVGTLFSGGQSSSLKLRKETFLVLTNLLIKNAVAQEACINDPGCTCQVAATGSSKAPNFLKFSSFNLPGTYGSAQSPMTVAGIDFCTLPAGTPNPGDGPDGQGRFGGFAFIQDIVTSCRNLDGSAINFTIKNASSGIWRNTEDSSRNPIHQPQIYGSFTLALNGSEIVLNCTIFLLKNGQTDFASCSDSNGNAITQDTKVTCGF